MKAKWPLTIRLLHWLTAIVVIGMFASGLWMVDLTYYSDWYKTAPHWHKSVGLILFALTLYRVLMRMISTRPPTYGSQMEKALSKIGHAFYICCCLVYLYRATSSQQLTDAQLISLTGFQYPPLVS